MDLIAISSSRIGAQEVQTVSARDLHTFLEVSTAFTTWITRRVEEYGFVYGRDFLPFLQESSGGRPATEYAITLDMAKELSMVERNSKGRDSFMSARRFIERLGLDEVLESAEIALAAPSVNSKFKYFCGVCWSKIRSQEVPA